MNDERHGSGMGGAGPEPGFQAAGSNDEAGAAKPMQPASGRSAGAADIQSAPGRSAALLPWFTADEIPLPPAAMREPPGACERAAPRQRAAPRERGLFDDFEEE